jgi:hypothetical protein
MIEISNLENIDKFLIQDLKKLILNLQPGFNKSIK